MSIRNEAVLMEQKLYCSLIEVKPLHDCSFDPKEVAGAIVRCYVRAGSVQDAEYRCKSALEEEHFSVVEVEWCVADDDVDWEYPNDDEHILFAKKAMETGSVVFGQFHSWGN